MDNVRIITPMLRLMNRMRVTSSAAELMSDFVSSRFDSRQSLGDR